MNNYKKIILNNGIPLYLYSDKSLKQVMVNYIIKYGSSGRWFKFELNGKKYNVLPGYAHYLEHLLGEHSKNGNVFSRFDDRHYNANAYTSSNHTSFHFCGVNDIKESIKELIEAVDDPVFDDKAVNKCRHAIEEEAASNMDEVDMVAVNMVEKNLFADFDEYDKTLSSIGSRATTRKINTETLYTCYDAFYTDDNKVLAIAGNIDEKKLVDYLNYIYSNIKEHKRKVVLPQYNYDPIRKRYEEVRANIEQDIHSMAIKFKILDDFSKQDLYFSIIFLMDYLLSYENDFYLYLRNKGLIDVLQYSYSKWEGDYLSFIHSFFSNKPEDYYGELLRKLNKRDLSKEEFELIKKGLISEEVRDLDDKYYSIGDFGNRMSYTEDYSRVDSFKRFNYERFREILESLDFGKYTFGRVRKLK